MLSSAVGLVCPIDYSESDPVYRLFHTIGVSRSV